MLFTKNEFKKKEIKKIKGQTKKGMKKEVNTTRDEQKQKSDEKRTEEILVRKRNTKNISKEIHFFEHGRVLEKKRRIKKETKLTLKKSRKKEDPSMRVKGSIVKHFQQRKVKHEKKNF